MLITWLLLIGSKKNWFILRGKDNIIRVICPKGSKCTDNFYYVKLPLFCCFFAANRRSHGYTHPRPLSSRSCPWWVIWCSSFLLPSLFFALSPVGRCRSAAAFFFSFLAAWRLPLPSKKTSSCSAPARIRSQGLSNPPFSLFLDISDVIYYICIKIS